MEKEADAGAESPREGKAGTAERPARANVVLRVWYVADRKAKLMVLALHGAVATAVALLAWETSAKLSHPVSVLYPKM